MGQVCETKCAKYLRRNLPKYLVDGLLNIACGITIFSVLETVSERELETTYFAVLTFSLSFGLRMQFTFQRNKILEFIQIYVLRRWNGLWQHCEWVPTILPDLTLST